MKFVEPLRKYQDITLAPLGRRPTTINDIKGLLSLNYRAEGNILEIGAWWGKTSFEIATRFPDRTVHTVDFLEVQLEYECAMTTRASREDLCKYAKHLPNVVFHYVKSQEFDYSGKDIGFVFIDGDHGYQGCREDSEKAIRYFQSTGRHGIIAWHDSFQPRFAVRQYLEREIDPRFERKAFVNSQVSYIRV